MQIEGSSFIHAHLDRREAMDSYVPTCLRQKDGEAPSHGQIARISTLGLWFHYVLFDYGGRTNSNFASEPSHEMFGIFPEEA